MSATQASHNPYRNATSGVLDRVRAATPSMPRAPGTARDMADSAVPDHPGTPGTTRAHIAGPIMTVARGILIAVIALILLGALYSVDIVNDPENPNTFTNLTETFADYGEVAFIMIGLGLIALGASVAMSYFGAFGGNGGR